MVHANDGQFDGIAFDSRKDGDAEDAANLHPSDDVNRSQSTNAVDPTTTRIAVMSDIPPLMTSVLQFSAAFEAKGADFTERAPVIGCERASALAKDRLASGKTLAEVQPQLSTPEKR